MRTPWREAVWELRVVLPRGAGVWAKGGRGRRSSYQVPIVLPWAPLGFNRVIFWAD